MKTRDLIKVLECMLRVADDRIAFVNLSINNKSENAIQIVYEDDIEYNIPIIGKSPLGILHEAAKICYYESENEKLKELEDYKPDEKTALAYAQWQSSKQAEKDLEKIKHYFYRLNKTQKDYIFGKMALMLLSQNMPMN